MQRIHFIALLLFCCVTFKSIAQHNASWGHAPNGWDDFYLGLVNDYKNLNTVGEPGYWLDVINDANVLSTYNPSDPNKKSVLYQYKYINQGVDTSTNWNSQKSLPPYGMNLLQGMRFDGDQVGVKCAWVIYMMQEDGGAVVAQQNIANATWLKNYFLNIKLVAQTGAGRKEIFILEPDLFGYIIQYLYNNGASATGMSNGVGLNMPAPMSTIAADPNYSYLADLPNTFVGVIQGLIRTIRIYNPQAYCGTMVSLWGAWIPQNISPAPTNSGLVWWTQAQIDDAIAYQAAFFQAMLLQPGFDKGDFIVSEKNGYPAPLASGGQVNWMWGDSQMQNYLYFFEKMGKSVCLPTLMWQVSLGQSNNAATYGITLTNPPVSPFVPLPNANQGYEDTFVQYMFNNITSFINAGFIGFLGGKGEPTGTDYSLLTSYGDKGFFFNQARTILDPGRPWNLNINTAIPQLGNDTTFCGTNGSLELNPGNMGASPILWSTGSTSPTITVTSAGTYWIQVGGGVGGCALYDTIVISNTYTANLGSNQYLCSVGLTTLNPGHQGNGVTYNWKYNGATLTGTTQYLSVSNPGVYSVTVTDPGCLPAQTSTVTITSGGLTTNSPACVNFNASATLTVTNTGGNYKWYTTSTGGSAIATGNSYTTPVLTGPTTYYVDDEALYSSTIIPKTAANGFTNSPGNGNPMATSASDWLYFDVLQNIQLVSLTTEAILYYSSGTVSATLQISNTSTGFNYSQAISFSTAVINSGPVVATAVLTLPTALTIPAGTGYRIRLSAAFNINYYEGNINNVIEPATYNNLVRTTSYGCALGCAIAGMPALYNWNIKSASTCARTPVNVVACNGVLPIGFLEVSVQKDTYGNRIIWSVTDESTTNAFQLEYSSNGTTFIPLTTPIEKESNYDFYTYDKSALKGNVYYRVKQTDFDGKFIYSRIVSLSSNTLSIGVQPNPSSNTFQVTVAGSQAIAELKVSIYDIAGNILEEKTFSPKQNIIVGEQLSAGFYLLKVSDIQSETVFKIIKN